MSKLGVATITVWALGLTSAGALAYTLNKPLLPPQPPAVVEPTRVVVLAPRLPAPPPAPPVQPKDEPRVVTVPVVEIVGRPQAPPVRAALTVKDDTWRDLSDMRCSDWKSLSSGSMDQGVRYCQ